jgi:hypothetical protein
VGLVVCLVLAVVVMVTHQPDLFRPAQRQQPPRNPLSPRTVNFVESITNEVKITVYYDKEEPLFSTVMDLLNEYSC